MRTMYIILILLSACASVANDDFFVLDVKNKKLLGQYKDYSMEEICVDDAQNKSPCVVLKIEEYERLLLQLEHLKIDFNGAK